MIFFYSKSRARLPRKIYFFSEVENLIGIGKDELEKKRPRLSTPPRHVVEDEIKAPIIPSSLTEDDSHFLLSRGLSSCNSKSPDRDAASKKCENREFKEEFQEQFQEAQKDSGLYLFLEFI